jgi:hypothetical protein
MFFPLKFRGITLGRRKRGSRLPSSLSLSSLQLGWWGIVPREVRRMGGDVSDMLTKELLSVPAVLARVDAARLGELLATPAMVAVAR